MDRERRRQYLTLASRLREVEIREEEGVMQQGMVTIVRASADIGNATALVAVEIDGRVRVVEVPTAKALFGLRLPARLQKDDIIYRNGNGLDVALGLSALRYADEPVAARGHADRYGPFTREFVLAGVVRAAKSDQVLVQHLAVLVPEKYDSAATRAAVAEALRGSHRFTLDGRDVQLTIRRVTVVHEGAAAWYALATKHQGNTIVIDGGGGTTNVALGRAGAFLQVKTRDTGLQRAWDTLDRELRRLHDGVQLTALERYELERALVDGTPYHLIVGGSAVRIDTLARPMLEPVGRLIAADVQEIVPKWERAEAIYFCGGQALHLAEVMRGAFGGRPVIPARPVEQNVRGALLMLGAEVGNAD